MKIRKTWLAAATAAGISLAGASAASAAPHSAPAATPLPGSALPFTAHTAVTGSVAGARTLTIQLWLTPDISALQNFATAVSTPGNAQFRHFLSPSDYAKRFGPTASQVTAVKSWLRTEGFSAIGTDAERTYVRATASVSAIDAAFGVREKLYRTTATVNAGPYQLRANDGAVALPSSLAGSVLAVTGLDNVAPSIPLDRAGAEPGQARITGDGVVPAVASSAVAPAATATDCSAYYGQRQKSGLPSLFGYTTLPVEVCGYDATQIRSAYGLTGTGGTGQTVAIAQLGLPTDMFLTLQDYAKANDMAAPSASLYSQESAGGTGASCGDSDPFDGEEQLDVEAIHVAAPGARELVVGGNPCDDGDFGEQGLYDALTAVLDGSGSKPLASIVSNSWEDIGTGEVAQFADMTNAILMRAAAEGVGTYFATGDEAGPGTPSTDPFTTAVGGDTLDIGKTGTPLFETGWSDAVWALPAGKTAWEGFGLGSASGGGPSTLWTEPAYQRGVVPAALTVAPGDKSVAGRSVPDISADADPLTGFGEGQLTFSTSDPAEPPVYSESSIGGTSLATPLIAGMVADAQQGRKVPFGFINPALYRLAGTSAIRDILPVTSKTPAQYHGTYCFATFSTCDPEQGIVEFDAQQPGLLGYDGQVTLKGYDNTTGLGTPNGSASEAALRRLG